MMYEIHEKNSLQGMTFVVRFPEKELDEKAYFTIENDMPDFLIPFRCHSVDGQIECTYHLGNLMPLRYHFGSHTPTEYVAFWNKILRPLLDCDDWFMDPFSFLMDSRYLYTDKEGKTVYYLYIPSKQTGTYEDLRSLAVELAKENHTQDAKMENQVLLSIMQDFRPKEFLTMLQRFVQSNAPAPAPEPPKVRIFETPPVPTPVPPVSPPPSTSGTPAERPVASGNGPDIVIDLNGNKKGNKKENKKEKNKEKDSGLFGKKKEKSVGPQKEPKPAKAKNGGLFGNNKQKEILMGAGAEPMHLDSRPAPVSASAPAMPLYMSNEETEGATVLDGGLTGARLRLISSAQLPPMIEVPLEEGRVFTVGRFDVNVGHRQCDFEFEKHTKAVSRRHAAIERDTSGYVIYDLSSTAGTFVDGERLTPNVAKRLENGSRVSFGTSGADYVWEV